MYPGDSEVIVKICINSSKMRVDLLKLFVVPFFFFFFFFFFLNTSVSTYIEKAKRYNYKLSVIHFCFPGKVILIRVAKLTIFRMKPIGDLYG